MNADTFEVKNELIQNRLRELAKQIRAWIPKGWGFTLFLFNYGGNGLFYISSAQREDMKAVVKEWLKREEERLATEVTRKC